ncbi:hypothetical protein JAAARDRAFT_68418 [Jaapia argillacea MUCL 33604]|uniref:TERF2-interacting telomeric protein 1 Myb domain-containing protein n=1 Tax=Jaapia argillacea MUCL 33604 TaxID=933084 RepID=A0A067PYI4_9AGAM|nr:hypothetical protein JAAARDRAFT_68418 [Jaapia argillacea MUCL 33604]
MSARKTRNEYTDEDDCYLVKYIGKYNPEKPNRNGNSLYKTLVENAEGKWPWSARHSWQSWRERYIKHAEEFDYRIRRWQKKQEKKQPRPSESQTNVPNTPRAPISHKKRSRSEEEVDSAVTKKMKTATVIIDITDDEGDPRRAGPSKRPTALYKAPQNAPIVKSDHRPRSSKTPARQPAPVAGPSTRPAVKEPSLEEPEVVIDHVASDDYSGAVDADDDGTEAAEVDEMIEAEVDDAMDEDEDAHNSSLELTERPPTPDLPLGQAPQTPEQGGEYMSLYPTISSVPAPYLSKPSETRQTEDPSVAGAFRAPDPTNTRDSGSQALPSTPAKSSSQHEPETYQEPTPPLSGDDIMAKPDGEGIPLSQNVDASRRKRPARAAVQPPLSISSLSPTSSDDESDAFTSLPSTPSVHGSQKELPHLTEGPYNSAFSDGKGRRRLSLSGRRVSGFDGLSDGSNGRDDREEGVGRSEMDEDVAWPPVRRAKRLDKGKNKATEPEDRRIAPKDQEERIIPAKSTRAQPKPARAPAPSPLDSPSPPPRPAIREKSKPAPFTGSAQFVKNFPSAASRVPPAVSANTKEKPSELPTSRSKSPIPVTTAETEVEVPRLTRPAPRRLFASLSTEPNAVAGPSRLLEHLPTAQSPVKRPSDKSVPNHTSDRKTQTSVNLGRKSSLKKGGTPLGLINQPKQSLRFSMPQALPASRRLDPFVLPEPEEHQELVRGGSDSGHEAEGRGRPVEPRRARRETFAGFPSKAEVSRSNSSETTSELLRRSFRLSHSSIPTQVPVQSLSQYPSRSSSLATTVRLPSPAPPSPRSANDYHLAVKVGTEALLQKMVDNHGFNADVVLKTYKEAKTFERTDKALWKMREAARDAAQEWFSKNESDGALSDMDAEDVEKQLMRRGSSASSRHAGEEVLRWEPAEDDESGSYTPPAPSRAHDFRRLVVEGRADEARRRERRRSSHGGMSPSKARKVTESVASMSPERRSVVHHYREASWPQDDDIPSRQVTPAHQEDLTVLEVVQREGGGDSEPSSRGVSPEPPKELGPVAARRLAATLYRKR